MKCFKRISFGFSFLIVCVLIFGSSFFNSANGQNKKVMEDEVNKKIIVSTGTKYNYVPDEAYIAALSFATAKDNLVSAVNLAGKVTAGITIRRSKGESVIVDRNEKINQITDINVTETQFEIKYKSGNVQNAIIFNYTKSKMPDAFEVPISDDKKGIAVKDAVNGFGLTWNDESNADKNARLFLDALYYIKFVLPAQKLEKFKEKAEIYKSMDPKPEISEDIRKCIVQATALTKEKKYEDAIKLYLKAMDIDETFPDAHFNLALLQSQVNDFGSAITEMKKYLMLVPNAKDARAAQDKIYEWELKVK